MNEEMSRPRFSGYDIAGAVVPPVAAAQGAMSAYKKFKSKKTDDSEAGGVRSMDAFKAMEKSDRPMQKPMPRANKPKIDLRKSYPE